MRNQLLIKEIDQVSITRVVTSAVNSLHTRSLDSRYQQIASKFNPDFFLRQEDWLFEFQHFKLSQVINQYVTK